MYFKAKIKSNGDKAFPCLRPFLIEMHQTHVYIYGLYYRYRLPVTLMNK